MNNPILTPHPYLEESLTETQALKRVVLAELIVKIHDEYGPRAMLLMSEDLICIAKADLQGLALLSVKTEFEILQEFTSVRHLETWMRNEKHEKPVSNPQTPPA